MICHDARELFTARADDALSAAEQAELQAHLATCAECQREWARFEQTVALLRGIEPAHAPAGFVDRVVAARPRPWYSRLARGLFLPWPVKLPLEAAAIVMVAGLAILIVQRSPELQQAAHFSDAPPPVALPPEPAKQVPADSTTTSVTVPAPPSEMMLNLQQEDVRSKGRSAPQSREDERETRTGARFGEAARDAAEAKRDRAQSAAVQRAKKMDASPAEMRKEASTTNEMLTGKMAAAPEQAPPPQASSPLSSATSSAPSGPPAAPSATPPTPESAPHQPPRRRQKLRRLPHRLPPPRRPPHRLLRLLLLPLPRRPPHSRRRDPRDSRSCPRDQPPSGSSARPTACRLDSPWRIASRLNRRCAIW
jgi:hypothetical protein